MVPIAQQASALNIPIFGWISSDPILADKQDFTTLVRLLMSVDAYSKYNHSASLFTFFSDLNKMVTKHFSTPHMFLQYASIK